MGESADKITMSKWKTASKQPREHLNDDDLEFFIDEKDSFSLAPVFRDLIGVTEFKEHFRDIIDFRVVDIRRFRK